MENVSIKVWYTKEESFFVSLKSTDKLTSIVIAIKKERSILEIDNLKLCLMNGDMLFWGKEKAKYGNPAISELIDLGWMDFEGTNQIVLHYDHQGITSQRVQICSANDVVKKIITGDRNFFRALDIDTRIFQYRLQKKNMFSKNKLLIIVDREDQDPEGKQEFHCIKYEVDVDADNEEIHIGAVDDIKIVNNVSNLKNRQLTSKDGERCRFRECNNDERSTFEKYVKPTLDAAVPLVSAGIEAGMAWNKLIELTLVMDPGTQNPTILNIPEPDYSRGAKPTRPRLWYPTGTRRVLENGNNSNFVGILIQNLVNLKIKRFF